MITTSDTVKKPYKMCRENSGLSQEYAAGLLHIAPRTLSDYENDKTTVPDDIVMAMGKIYDTNFLVWWHLKCRTPYGEILPEIYEPSTVGDMMFSYVLARDATDDSYESFKDVYEDRQLQISEIPRLEEAIRKAEGAASNLTAIALFARKKIQECEEINTNGSLCNIEDVEKIDRAMLLPEHIARIMHMDPQAIRVYARTEKGAGREHFPFPTIIYGKKGVVRFPKLEFLEWARKNREKEKNKSISSQAEKEPGAVKCHPMKKHSHSLLRYQYGL